MISFIVKEAEISAFVSRKNLNFVQKLTQVVKLVCDIHLDCLFCQMTVLVKMAYFITFRFCHGRMIS